MALSDLDLVYPVKHAYQNEELRYSLRSVSKNLPHRNIYIVGYKPYWMTGVKHLTTRQSPQRYYANTLNAIMTACKDPEVSENFILMNDDYFIMKPLKILQNYHRGSTKDVLKMFANRRHSNRYIKTMAKTASFLETLGYKNPLCYEVHAPMIINKDKFSLLNRLVNPLHEFNKRSLYGNYYNIGGRRIKDVKVTGSNIPKGAFISTSDRSWLHKPVGDYIRNTFREPSPYERF